MKEVMDKIRENTEEDYNLILDIYPEIDTNFAKSLSTDLQYITEKAKLPINKHKNSNWVDKSFIMIGRCKLYAAKVDSAIYVFRYVNTNTDEPEAKHESMAYLLRSYLLENDYRYASEVNSYLEKQTLSKHNKKLYNLSSAQFYKEENNLRKVVERLEEAIPLEKNSDDWSRYHFIAGQIYQRLGEHEKAYDHYDQSLRKNPPYDIIFNAKLNMAQVTNLSSSDLKKIDKFFRKMLKDDKNEEYKDRIYYEMGRFELKQNNISESIKYLNKSIHTEGARENQKAYAYLQMGKIHYDHIDTLPDKATKYRLAKEYYDSTITSLNPEHPEYKEILERQEVLGRFVKEIEIVEREDSLQRMARMDSAELNRVLEERVAHEKNKFEEELLRQKREEEAAKKGGAPAKTAGGSDFILYDKMAVSMSYNKFVEKWGNRELEDNWRRSNRTSFDDFDDEKEVNEDSLAAVAKEKEKADKDPEFEGSKEDYLKGVPFDEAAMAASNRKLESALYKVGKIYKQELEEPENAIQSFQDYLDRFPGGEHEAEVLYFMYLLCDHSESCEQGIYRQRVMEKYPNSIYARIIENPNYLTDNKASNDEASEAYDNAFTLYQNGRYVESRRSLENILQTFPKSSIKDKVALLHAMTYARTDDLPSYEGKLKAFLRNYRTSDLTDYAEELLKRLHAHTPASVLEVPEGESDFVQSDSASVYHFILVMQKEKFPAKKLLPLFYELHQTYFKNEDLVTRNVDYNDSLYIVAVKQFNTQEAALNYQKEFLKFLEFKDILQKTDKTLYIINRKNYNSLLSRKKLDEYKAYYKQHY